MKLEIGNFIVKDVVFGDRTFFEDSVLTINKQEAEEFIKQDSHIIKVEIEIAKPGEDIRILPVKEAVEPRIRVDGRALFPGVTGELAPAMSIIPSPKDPQVPPTPNTLIPFRA